MEGGFDVDDSKKYDIQETYAIVTLPDFTSVPYPNPNLPEKVKEIFHVLADGRVVVCVAGVTGEQVAMSAAAIIKVDSAEKKDQIAAWTPEQVRASAPLPGL